MWIRFVWIVTLTSGVLFWTQQWNFDFCKTSWGNVVYTIISRCTVNKT